jgi:tetratricopeptide (TPR) repeat protein
LSACAAQHAATAPPPAAQETAPAKSKRIDPSADNVRKGDTAWAAGQYDSALYMYVTALQSSPNDALTLAKIGDIHELQGHIDVALEAFERAHAADPKEPRIAERLGLHYLRVAKIDEAEALFNVALAQDPARWRALDGLGEIARARGDFLKAIAYDDQALQGKGANAPLILAHRGRVNLLSGQLTEAESDLRASVGMAPQLDTYRCLAEVLVREHDNAGAYESLTKVMDMASAFDQLGLMLMSAYDYRAAADYFGKAVAASAGWNEDAQKNLSIAKERLAQSGKTALAVGGN